MNLFLTTTASPKDSRVDESWREKMAISD